MRNNHEITLKQYAAHCDEQPISLGTAGSYGMEKLTIIREGVWAEYDILATFHPPVGDALPGEWISDRDVYAVGTAPTTGAQVAYKLAEPVPFTATGGQAVPALTGVNTLLTDADTLTVTGRADPVKRITDLEAAAKATTS